MQKDLKTLLTTHPDLTHSQNKRVLSHAQRPTDDGWIVNTLMIDGCDVPFRYKRRKPYSDLKGARVNLTYYPAQEQVAGIEVDIMKVVRLRRT